MACGRCGRGFRLARRLGPRLRELAETAEGEFVPRLAADAVAIDERDGDALDESSMWFEGIGALMFAADAAARAAQVYDGRGKQRDARRMARRAEELAARCPGLRTGTLAALDRPPTLTAREFEIAGLAGHGLSSKEIAARLVLSVRTVDSHLYRVYAKLGVVDRRDLRSALSREPAAAP